MRFVPIKSTDTQAMLTVHRVRTGFVEERTATINRLRGLLSEFGIVLPLRAENVRRRARAACEQLPAWASRGVGDLLDHIVTLDQRIDEYDIHLKQLAHTDERSERLMPLRGVGPMTATALLSSIGNGHEFKNVNQWGQVCHSDTSSTLDFDTVKIRRARDEMGEL
jgi:transposase